MIFFLLSFIIIGAGIKYMDAAFDEGTVSKKLAIIIAPLLAFLGWYTMSIDQVAATILIAVLLGVLLTFKIDNIAHGLGLAVIAPIILFTGIEFMIVPLVFLVVFGMLDEFGNDFVDKKKNEWNSKKTRYADLVKFFEHRWSLKIAIFTLVLIDLIPWYFFIAMIMFDYAYLSVGFYSDIKQGNRSTTLMRKTFATVGLFNK